MLGEDFRQVQVQIEGVALQAEGEHLVLDRLGVVIMDAEGVLNDALHLADKAGRILGSGVQLSQHVVHEGEDVRQGAVDDRNHGRVEGLAGNAVAHELQSGLHRLDDVGEGQVLEVEGLAQVRQDDDYGVWLDRPGEHQGLHVGGVHGVLVDDLHGPRMEGVQGLDGNLHVRRQRDVGTHSHVDPQTLETRVGLARQIEANVGRADVGKGELLVRRRALALGIAVQGHRGGGSHMDGGTSAGAAGGGPQEAQLHRHFQILGIQADASGQVDVLHAYGELALAQGEGTGFGGGSRVVQFDAMYLAIHRRAQAGNGEYFAARLQLVAHHGGVEEEGGIGEEFGTDGHGPLVAQQGASVQVEEEGQVAFHIGRDAGLGGGGQAEAVRAQVQ